MRSKTRFLKPTFLCAFLYISDECPTLFSTSGREPPGMPLCLCPSAILRFPREPFARAKKGFPQLFPFTCIFCSDLLQRKCSSVRLSVWRQNRVRAKQTGRHVSWCWEQMKFIVNTHKASSSLCIRKQAFINSACCVSCNESNHSLWRNSHSLIFRFF